MRNYSSRNNLPTLKELEQYNSGKMNASRKMEIDEAAKDNPLVAEAIEGFKAMPLYGSIPDAGSIFENSFRAAGSGGKMGVASKGAGLASRGVASIWSFNTVAILLALAGVIAALVIFIPRVGENDNINHSAAQTEAIVPIENDTVQNASPISRGEIIAQNDSISINIQKLGELPASNDGVEIKSNPLNTSTVGIESIDANSLAVAKTGDSKPLPARTGMVAIDIKQILHYKVADYSIIRANNWQPLTPEETGLPAKYASESEKAEETKMKVVNIPYLSYLEQCMSAFDNGNYPAAIDRFNTILDQYPDDVNAQFYSALAYYKNGKPEDAISYFDLTMRNTIRTFNEEAVFYKAKSLKDLGRFEEAQQLFTQIVQRNKFYADQALEELK